MRLSLFVCTTTFFAACSSAPSTSTDASAPSDAGASVDATLDASVVDAEAPPDSGIATVQILAINDFHGALRPNVAGEGGAALLAAHVARLREPNSVFVAAGDLIGGSPLESGLFHDEPTIVLRAAV